jgi:RES domain-containing protein
VLVERVSVDHLPSDWPEKTEATRALGDAWLAADSSALLIVPSAIVPDTFNVLLNPAHKDAKRTSSSRRASMQTILGCSSATRPALGR